MVIRCIFIFQFFLSISIVAGLDSLSMNQSSPSNNITNWNFSHTDKIGILILDYNTLEVKRIYSQFFICREYLDPLSNDSLRQRVVTFIESIWPYWPRNERMDASTYRNTIESKIKVIDYGKLVLFHIPSSDFGGKFLYHRCSGQIVFAGSVIHNGVGIQFFPAEDLSLENISMIQDSVQAPSSIIVSTESYIASEERGIEVFNSSKRLNFVQEYSYRDYHVFVLLYPRQIGLFNPDNAEWVIVLYRH